MKIYGGECDVADDGVVSPPAATQQGNAITILLNGISHEGDPQFCYFGIGYRGHIRSEHSLPAHSLIVRDAT